MKKPADALEMLDRLVPLTDEDHAVMAEARLNQTIAQLLHDLRERSGMTQAELAKLLGTTQSAVSRQESLNYRGHTLSHLARVFTALGAELTVDAKPLEVTTKRKVARIAAETPAKATRTSRKRVA